MTDFPAQLPADAEIVSHGGFNLHIGPIYHLPADGGGGYAFIVAEKHMNAGGSVHGGMLMSFADVAMGRTGRHLVGAQNSSTVSLSCDFVGPGRVGDLVEARVRVSRRTRTMVFLSADIVAGEKLLMVATGLWKLG